MHLINWLNGPIVWGSTRDKEVLDLDPRSVATQPFQFNLPSTWRMGRKLKVEVGGWMRDWKQYIPCT